MKLDLRLANRREKTLQTHFSAAKEHCKTASGLRLKLTNDRANTRLTLRALLGGHLRHAGGSGLHGLCAGTGLSGDAPKSSGRDG